MLRACETVKALAHPSLCRQKIDHHRRVVARVLPASRRPSDLRGFQPRRQGRAKQEVVEAKAGVTFERVPPVLPERLDALSRVKVPDGVRPTLIDQVGKGVSDFWTKEGVISPPFGGVNVELCWHDIKIAYERDRHTVREKLVCMA